MSSCEHDTASVPSERGSNGPRVVDVFRDHGDEYSALHPLSSEQSRLLHDIQVCRTAALGGHVCVCNDCGYRQPQYNSCRNRSCPNCQALAQGKWIDARSERILPVGHHHVVFTLPAQLRNLTRLHSREVYRLFFCVVAETLSGLAAEVLDAQLGITAVLHTWTRELLYHPHIHCIVTAGGLTRRDSTWVERTRSLFPAHRIKARFRAKLLAGLENLRKTGVLPLPGESPHASNSSAWRALVASLPPKKKWVVYLERPFGNSTHVLSYLGRYTHRIAISDHRLISVDPDAVAFRTRRDESTTLSPLEFIRRFLLHVLPKGFHKIRHFGLYAPGNASHRLAIARHILQEHAPPPEPAPELPPGVLPDDEPWVIQLALLTGKDPLACPRCQRARFHIVPLPRPHVTREPPPWEDTS